MGVAASTIGAPFALHYSLETKEEGPELTELLALGAAVYASNRWLGPARDAGLGMMGPLSGRLIDKLTIEHIASQSDGTISPAVGMIGNLLFVSDALNKKLKNKAAKEKIKILKSRDVPLDDFLKSVAAWDQTAIETRTKYLAKLSFESIFRV